ncbi:DJ-1/PfpI family protein [Noviherbaspirillum humi]|uniref:DJ-1/PfpI family protein n=1 Tax=Noviherbaspirillum humi TaxID=1688639 RepID=A0A239IA85_9BURK|nr:DJ-1/PfpI family protein [Noviherbaspirillum humi]SNS90716.1 DJ-1/PfpI family protein [Noviherbaspirillum humi]
MDLALSGMNVAIFVTNGVEQQALAECRKALEVEGALPRLISDKPESVASMDQGKPGSDIATDLLLNKADAKAFDALLLLGGDVNGITQADREEAARFVQNFSQDGKTIGAVGEAAQLASGGNLVSGEAGDIDAFMRRFIEAVSARMQENLRGKPDENAVGIASS